MLLTKSADTCYNKIFGAVRQERAEQQKGVGLHTYPLDWDVAHASTNRIALPSLTLASVSASTIFLRMGETR